MANSFQKILVPIDFNPTSLFALAKACELGRALQSKLTLIHATDFGRLAESLSGMDAIQRLAAASNMPLEKGALQGQPAEDIESAMHRRLREAMQNDECQGVEFRTACVQGYPSQEIVKYAREQDIDLIVMGTHGRGPIGYLLLGSVAENVVRNAHCPVLTVRHGRRAL